MHSTGTEQTSARLVIPEPKAVDPLGQIKAKSSRRLRPCRSGVNGTRHTHVECFTIYAIVEAEVQLLTRFKRAIELVAVHLGHHVVAVLRVHVWDLESFAVCLGVRGDGEQGLCSGKDFAALQSRAVENVMVRVDRVRECDTNNYTEEK